MFVIDTNIISEIMKPQPSPLVCRWLERVQHECYLTSVSIKELHYGVLTMSEGKRKRALREMVDALVATYSSKILAFDALCAQECAQLHAKVVKSGHNPTIEDLMIASICKIHKATLATRNTKDFLQMDINLINPFGELS